MFRLRKPNLDAAAFCDRCSAVVRRGCRVDALREQAVQMRMQQGWRAA